MLEGSHYEVVVLCTGRALFSFPLPPLLPNPSFIMCNKIYSVVERLGPMQLSLLLYMQPVFSIKHQNDS